MNLYTLWLVPPPDISDQYQKIIDKYCEKYSIHTFLPHITLTGGIESVDDQTMQSIQQVLNDTRPIDVSISEVSISTTYFQCVFARVNPTPQLLDLHVNLRSACNIVAEDFFMPHMSLVYADIGSEEKQNIAQKIVLPTTSFTCNTVHLVDGMSKDTSTWKQVETFELS